MKVSLRSNRGYFILAGRRPWDKLPTALLSARLLSNAPISLWCIPSATGVLREKSRWQILLSLQRSHTPITQSSQMWETLLNQWNQHDPSIYHRRFQYFNDYLAAFCALKDHCSQIKQFVLSGHRKTLFIFWHLDHLADIAVADGDACSRAGPGHKQRKRLLNLCPRSVSLVSLSQDVC